MFRRLLAVSGGSGGFTPPPPPGLRTLTAANRGSWSNVDPRAFYYNGATYFTWVSGANGDIGVSKYVHATGVTTSTTISAAFNQDDHATPSVIVRTSDHKIVVAYSAHDGANIYRWISTNAEDISAGSTASGGVGDGTYMTLMQMGSGRVYWFYRTVDGGGQGFLQYVTSTDGLFTWGSGGSGTGPTSLFASGAGGVVPYWRIASDWNRYIHIFTTNADPNTSSSFLYHFYIDDNDGSLHKSDGTTISASLPLTATNVTLVTDGISSGGYCLSMGGCVDSGGKPATLVRVGTGGQTDNSERVARWTGSVWQVNEVYTTGGTFPGYVYTPGATIHKTNPDIVYGARKTSGHYRISKFVSPDSGTTWNETTLGSTDESFYPETPINPAAGLDVLWPSGSFTSDNSFAFGMEGYG
jgi:hypothetical protein